MMAQILSSSDPFGIVFGKLVERVVMFLMRSFMPGTVDIIECRKGGEIDVDNNSDK
jgi:hypothetical protein